MAKRSSNTGALRVARAKRPAVAEPPAAVVEATPILRSLRGILKSADVSRYRSHLAAKYR
jgi:hypothetical protein